MFRSRRTPTRYVVLGLTVVLGTLAACGIAIPNEQLSMPQAATSIQSSTPLSGVEMESLNTTDHIPVYWLGEQDTTVSLYREFVTVPAAADPVADAVSYMLSEKPSDPKYFSAWRPSATVGASISSNNVITIDLAAKAFAASLDHGMAERSIAQLVFTATAAASNAGVLTEGLEPSVRILVDGQSDYNAFGQIPLDHNFARDAKLAAPLWIIDPQFNSSFASGEVTFHGVSATFTGGEFWEITRRDTDTSTSSAVATGTLSTGQKGLGHNEFSFSYVLAPGDYTVTAWGMDSASSHRVGTETKDFTVTK